MAQAYHLTQVELELMEILWKIHQGTVRDVMTHLAIDRDLAYTSVSTILRILEQKKFLTTEKLGRQHIYIPTLNKKTFLNHSINKIVNQNFSGNFIDLVAYLVNKQDLSKNDIKQIEKLIHSKKKEFAK